jgi:S-(hydroxymethyl)glutathione dehydrogenase / alcohol dehydrogenase
MVGWIAPLNVSATSLSRARHCNAATEGWGETVVNGAAGVGQEITSRPFRLVTVRIWRGSAFGGVKGRFELPDCVERYIQCGLKQNDSIAHTMGEEENYDAFGRPLTRAC